MVVVPIFYCLSFQPYQLESLQQYVQQVLQQGAISCSDVGVIYRGSGKYICQQLLLFVIVAIFHSSVVSSTPSQLHSPERQKGIMTMVTLGHPLPSLKDVSQSPFEKKTHIQAAHSQQSARALHTLEASLSLPTKSDTLQRLRKATRKRDCSRFECCWVSFASIPSNTHVA